MPAKNFRGVAVLFAVLLATATFACAKKPLPGALSVPGNQTWTDTGLDIEANSVITVKASGQVFANPTDSGGPDGINSRPEWNDYRVTPKAAYAALIGKVGRNGLPFVVGQEHSVRVIHTGRLFLGVNDKDTADNKGEFKAVVTVK
ncbi:MAG TPA: hypothetical protein PKL08_08020 [Thermoanaerobaculaceae bacterium]|nr:hypothetical protein [Thermoanaerobaculaceae bacterium]